MSGKSKDVIAFLFLGLLLVLTYFLVIKPGKTDDSVSIAGNTSGPSAYHTDEQSGDFSNNTKSDSAEKEATGKGTRENEASNSNHVGDGEITLDESTEPVDTRDSEKTLNFSEGTHDTPNGTQDYRESTQYIKKETQDNRGSTQSKQSETYAYGETESAPDGIENAQGESGNTPGETRDTVEETQGRKEGTSETQNPDNGAQETPRPISETEHTPGKTQDTPGNTQDTADETKGAPGEMQAADVLRKLYSYTESLDRYQEIFELLTEDFTLQLEIFKQFGVDKLDRNDITGEQINAFAMFLMNSELKDILGEISEGDNAVIEYMHAMYLDNNNVIELVLAADLVKEAGIWKITCIREI